MYVNEDNFDVLDRVSKEMMTNYDIRWTDAENIKGYIDTESMYEMIEDLLCEIGVLKEKIEDIIQDRNDNYKPITSKEMYEIYE